MVDALISSLIIIMIFIVASMFLCFEECSGEIDWDELLRKIKKLPSDVKEVLIDIFEEG